MRERHFRMLEAEFSYIVGEEFDEFLQDNSELFDVECILARIGALEDYCDQSKTNPMALNLGNCMTPITNCCFLEIEGIAEAVKAIKSLEKVLSM